MFWPTLHVHCGPQNRASLYLTVTLASLNRFL